MLKTTRLAKWPTPLNISGPQIRVLRNQRGWSQATLAARCQVAGWDVTRDTIANIEAQRRWVGDRELMLLSSVLGVEVADLLPKRTRRWS